MLICSRAPERTQQLGLLLGGIVEPGDFIALNGNLGSGKTLLVKGLAAGLGISPAEVTSPTFGFIQEYGGRLPLYHFDIYRLDYPEQLEDLGYEEYFFGKGVTVVEWAAVAAAYFPPEYLQVDFATVNAEERELRITAVGERGAALAARWKGLVDE